jgi:hypothetical protein
VKCQRAATHYAAVLDVIRNRIIELELAYPTVDVLAGFTDTYTSKLLCNPPLKRMSVDSLFSILGALALVPKFESDQDRLQRLRQHRDWQKRAGQGGLCDRVGIPSAGLDRPSLLALPAAPH